MPRLFTEIVPDYLNRKKVTTAQDWILGKYYIDTIQSRNNLFIVYNKDNQKHLLLKQNREESANNIHSLETESTIYWLTNNYDIFSKDLPHLPDFYFYDYKNSIQLLRFYNDSLNLQEFTNQNRDIKTKHISTMAEILYAINIEEDKNWKEQINPNYFQRRIPWIFTIIGGQPNVFNLKSNADKEIYRIIQSHPVLIKKIPFWKSNYQYTHFIHGDIKFSNFLIEQSSGKIRLLDFEMADIGDPSWDVGGLIHSVLLNWAYENTAKGNQINNKLESIFLEITKAYPQKKIDFWVKSLSMASVRLLQTALESSHQDQSINPSVKAILQLSINCLSSPHVALKKLFNYG